MRHKTREEVIDGLIPDTMIKKAISNQIKPMASRKIAKYQAQQVVAFNNENEVLQGEIVEAMSSGMYEIQVEDWDGRESTYIVPEFDIIKVISGAMRRTASYGNFYIHDDMEKGLSDNQIIRKIRERYIDIGQEQAKEIVDAIRAGGPDAPTDWSKRGGSKRADYWGNRIK